MARKKLILVVSEAMDENKKEERNENGLVRMSQVARGNMGFDEDKVELYPVGSSGSERVKKALLLDIFKAFARDIKKLKAGGTTAEELKRVGFVTSKTFRRVTGKHTDRDDNIWISDDVSEIVFGCDPEFLLFNRDSGDIVRASSVMGYHGNLGCDGAMAEVRPLPALTPEELVMNITNILKDTNLTHDIHPYKWKSECYHADSARDYPVGGHIHVGNPTQLLKVSGELRDDFFKTFNKILDELLAIPMIRLDGSEKGSTRRTACKMGKYGYFGEWRKCNGRLEHRTLSGMWLTHPSLAKAVLGVAKMIIDEVYLRAGEKGFEKNFVAPENSRGTNIWSSDYNGWKDIPLAKGFGCVTSSANMIKILNASDPSTVNKTFLNEWLRNLKKFSTYRTYKDYVDALYDVLRLPQKEIKKWDRELQKNWLQKKRFIVDL